MSDYRFPEQDALFVLHHLVDVELICKQAGLGEMAEGLAASVLQEAAKLGQDVLAPLNQQGDQQPATLVQGQVQQTPGFAEAYQQYVDSGWAAMAAPESFGGQGLPHALAVAVNEVWQSANLSWALCPLLAQGAVSALLQHASEDMQQQYLPKLVSGEWTGTMNLTEADAGTDLAAIKTRAIPEGDHYRVFGQKIFITWGDHQMAENILHLVLARLPDAPPGVKGISMLLVPKYLPQGDQLASGSNNVQVLALEHKLGIHGSPTCVMQYGDQEGAVGYLIGEPHAGLKYMFTMMNDARQAVGLQGLAIAERAYQQAVAYAKERVQGTLDDGSRVTITHHPDVRRMLLHIKASLQAMRALAYVARAETDRGELAQDAASRAQHQARSDLYTPIIKGWLTEMAQELTSLALQVHGGMGYIEETGIAQHFRDARILTIYEGTSGIQALDLVGRKILLDQGASVKALMAEIHHDLQQVDSKQLPTEVAAMQQALQDAQQSLIWLAQHAPSDPHAAGAVSHHLMMLLGYLCGGWLMTRSAVLTLDDTRMQAEDPAFLHSKRLCSRFFAEQLLPRTGVLRRAIEAGSDTLMAMDENAF
ncbi:acyl-CoA dehydrogenase [Pontibacter sp. JAM-7]|uniref:acyl-CoA dehydrogenase n=1 Tax=Pontibacter sp. JAM-7 TaxID=3366581 RepID=UPI003AF5BE0E